MSYRIAFIVPIYPAFHAKRISASLANLEQNYSVLQQTCAELAFGSKAYFAQHFQAFGNETCEIYPNIEVLQKAWRDNFGFSASKNLELATVIAQLSQFEPDIVHFLDPGCFAQSERQILRDSLKANTRYSCWKLSQVRWYSDLADFDLVITGSRFWQAQFQKNGVRAKYLACAAHLPEQMQPVSQRELDLSFCGTISEYGPHQERTLALDYFLRRTPLQAWVDYAPKQRWPALLAKIMNAPFDNLLSNCTYPPVPACLLAVAAPLISSYLRSMPNFTERFAGRIHAAVAGPEYFSVLQRSKITLNIHGRLPGNWVGNVRMFEATAAGACLVTDYQTNITEYFAEDLEVVTYRSLAEALDKIKYLLAHPLSARQIAEAGHKRCLAEHTNAHRFQSYHQHFLTLLKG